MDHEEAVRQNTTERYMLDELDSEQRDQFEEHYFDCQDCAKDVRAAVMLIEHIKEIEREVREKSGVPVPPVDPGPKPIGWLDWLRQTFALPAFAVPTFAAPVFATVFLLALAGYQNLVQFPQSNKPHVLPAITMNLSTLAGERPFISIPAGGGFLLDVVIPPRTRYPAYRAELYNPNGKTESIPLPTTATDVSWSIQIPEGNRNSGVYGLVVYGTAAGGPQTEVGRSSFELQIQK